MDIEIKIDVPQDKIEKIRRAAEIELDMYKKLPLDKLRDSHIKFLTNKVMSKIYETIQVKVKGSWDDDPYSETAKTNMTAQVLVQWQFLEENLHAKESELKRIQKLYQDSALPNYSDEENKRIVGIDTVKIQITEHENYIRKLQKEKRIHKIIF